MPLNLGKNISLNDTVSVFRNDAISFLKSLPDQSVDLIVTDPAYSGMNQHLSLGKGRIVGKYSEKSSGKWFEEFHDTPENYAEFLGQCVRVLKNNRHIFLMFDSFSLITLGPLVREYLEVKNLITWDKVNIGMGHYFRRQSEFIIFGSKGKRPVSRRDMPDIWRIKRIHKAHYPTQKPVELFEAMISASRASADDEFLVCDPFLGSGSAAIAALKQNCSFVGADISNRSIELATQRIKTFNETGVDVAQPQSAIDPNITKVFW